MLDEGLEEQIIEATNRRFLFLESCRAIGQLPLCSASRSESDTQASQSINVLWKKLPTNFFLSKSKLVRTHALLTELGALPQRVPDARDASGIEGKLEDICIAMVLQDMIGELQIALRSDKLMHGEDSSESSLFYEGVVARWAIREVDAFEQRWENVVQLIPSQAMSEYRQRPETMALLEQAGAQIESLYLIILSLDELFLDSEHSNLDIPERAKVRSMLKEARRLSVAVRTISWLFKKGIQHSTPLVSLVDEAIRQPKPVILGDALLSLLLSQFDSSIFGPNMSFIRLLCRAPSSRPQAGAELLMSMLLRSSKYASSAAEIEEMFLLPEEGAWITVMTLITHTVSFASTSDYEPTDSITPNAFKNPADVPPESLRMIRRLYPLTEKRFEQPDNTVVSKDRMASFREQAAMMAEYGSAKAIVEREFEMRADQKEHLEQIMGPGTATSVSESTSRYHLNVLKLKYEAKQLELARLEAKLEDEEAQTRNVSMQLDAVNSKLKASLHTQNHSTFKRSGVTKTLAPSDQALRGGFNKVVSHVLEQATARAGSDRATSETGAERPEKVDGSGGMQITAATVYYVGESATFRLGIQHTTFKRLKEHACVYFRLANPDKYELYDSVERAAWYEPAEVTMQLEKFKYSTLQLRLKSKSDVKRKVIGDDGALEKADVRSARISELTEDQRREREKLINEDKREKAINIMRKLVLIRGPRARHSPRVVAALLHIIMLGCYYAYIYQLYSSNGQDTALVRAAASYTVSTPDGDPTPTRIARDSFASLGSWFTVSFVPKVSGREGTADLPPTPVFSPAFDENIAWRGLEVLQIRSQPKNCTLIGGYAVLGVDQCQSVELDDADYTKGWNPVESGGQPDLGFTYTPKSTLLSEPISSEDGSTQYGPGGYPRTVYTADQLTPAIEELFNSKWLDLSTRALVISSIIHNRALNLFVDAKLLIEFRPSGFTVATAHVRPLSLDIIDISFGVELLRVVVLAIYLIAIVHMLRPFLLPRFYSDPSFRPVVLRQMSLLTILVCTLMIFELVYRSKVESSLKGIANAVTQSVPVISAINATGTSLEEQLRELNENIVFNFEEALADSQAVRSITSVCLFLLGLKSTIALMQCFDTWYLFDQRLRSGCSALVAVCCTLFVNLLGLTRVAEALIGTTSPQFNTVVSAFSSLVQLIVGPTRFYDDDNPYELADFSLEADGTTMPIPVIPLLMLFEFVVMTVCWSLFVSVFVEAYSFSSNRVRQELAMKRSIAVLGWLRHKDVCKLVVKAAVAPVTELQALVRELSAMGVGAFYLAREKQKSLLAHNSGDLPSDVNPGSIRMKARYRKAKTRLQKRLARVETMVMLGQDEFTPHMFDKEVERLITSYGLKEQQSATAEVATRADVVLESQVSEDPAVAVEIDDHFKGEESELSDCSSLYDNSDSLLPAYLLDEELGNGPGEERRERNRPSELKELESFMCSSSSFPDRNDTVMGELLTSDEEDTDEEILPSIAPPRSVSFQLSTASLSRQSAERDERHNNADTGPTSVKGKPTGKYVRLGEDQPQLSLPTPAHIRANMQRRLPDDRVEQASDGLRNGHTSQGSLSRISRQITTLPTK